jgi:acetaldehyde dehydrogenase (acetylating)
MMNQQSKTTEKAVTTAEKATTVEALIEMAKKAQEQYADFSQNQVDAIVKNVSEKLTIAAESLAELAHTETGFGNVADKTTKNLFASEGVYHQLKDEKTVGIIHKDDVNQVVEYAIPMGVVAALVPMTNPTSTVIFKSLIALKTRNAIVFSPHPHAVKAISETARLVNEAAVQAGAPDGLIQVIEKPSLEGTQTLMKHIDTALILATGGGQMVKAAYSSGNPAIGVGPGNCPALIDDSADVDAAIQKIIKSKTFDYGTICASEQSIITLATVKAAVKEALIENNAYLLSKAESDQLATILLRENGMMNPQIVGQSAYHVAQLAGITVPQETSVLVAESDEVSQTNPYSREKLTPVLGLFTVSDWSQGIAKCNAILRNEGAGHTAALHTKRLDHAEEFGEKIVASRLLVNTPSTFGGIGASTGLAPSLTLGCGAIGGSSISDNVEVKHLLNIKRLAYHVTDI